jgi:hypothetical protein
VAAGTVVVAYDLVGRSRMAAASGSDRPPAGAVAVPRLR